MASLTSDGKKRWRIRFTDVHGTKKSKTIRISDLNKKQAEGIFRHVDNIISARLQGAKFDDVEAAWIGTLTDRFYNKLVKAGLMEPREIDVQPESLPEPEVFDLERLTTEHMDRRKTSKGRDASESSWKNWRAAKNHLLRFFDADQDITTITKEDAHQFRVYLDERRIKKTKATPKGRPMLENAKRKVMENTKVFFNGAIRRGLIDSNPFEHQISSIEENRSRDYYLTIEDGLKVRDACPDPEWRVLFSLWRFVGLRKMEVFNLVWDDVLWDQGKMLVHSSKTRHHEGKDVRYVPLRDIYDDLLALSEQADAGATNIITRFSESNSNLDKPMKVILHRAGLVPWPKLFQNMRASCETDWLSEGHPAHVVAGWIGHSVKIQRKSYAQITAGHFDAFNSRDTVLKNGHDYGHDGDRTGQNTAENDGRNRGRFTCTNEKTLENKLFSSVFSTGDRT